MGIVLTAALLRVVMGPPHAVDEYLQATLLSIGAGEVHLGIRMVPGTQVFPKLLERIDTDHDGKISRAERDAYVRAVLGDFVLNIDGVTVVPSVVSATMPPVAEMREGIAAIRIELRAPGAATPGAHRLTFTNRHLPGMSVYLMNVLVPDDSTIHLGAQTRTADQSEYRLDFRNGDPPLGRIEGWWAHAHSLADAAEGFPGMFRLGVRHIAEGTDHLLFLLTLLLPAPLIAASARWRGRASLRDTVARIVKIVTAFTIGHSISLSLAAFGVVQLPSRPIEALIALSILVSGVHAARPIFAGREPVIAAGFGLVHGLAFAAALNPLGMRWSERIISILGFNIGIEAMQLLVIGVTLPSLLMLSRTRAYSAFRMAGVLFAGTAAVLWIIERTVGVATPVDPLVNAIAASAIWINVALFGMASLVWMLETRRRGYREQSAPIEVL